MLTISFLGTVVSVKEKQFVVSTADKNGVHQLHAQFYGDKDVKEGNRYAFFGILEVFDGKTLFTAQQILPLDNDTVLGATGLGSIFEKSETPWGGVSINWSVRGSTRVGDKYPSTWVRASSTKGQKNVLDKQRDKSQIALSGTPSIYEKEGKSYLNLSISSIGVVYGEQLLKDVTSDIGF